MSNSELRVLEFLQDVEKVQKIVSQNPQYFVQIQGLSIDKIPIIVTEFMDQSDIQTFYKSYSLTISQKIEMSIQICEAMSTLHSYNNMSLVHGRLKPQNIVVNSGEQVKVCFLQTKDTLLQGKDEGTMPMTSNLFYTAPEILENNEPAQSSDIWAFGCILSELIQEEPIWKNMTVGMIYKRLFFKHPPDVPTSIPIEIRQIIHDCLETDPRVRPTFKSLQQRLLKVDLENNVNLTQFKTKVSLNQISQKSRIPKLNTETLQLQQTQGESKSQMNQEINFKMNQEVPVSQ